MRLEDRIQNIKTLLKYCPVATNEVMLYDDVCEDFFSKFFSSHPILIDRTSYQLVHTVV